MLIDFGSVCSGIEAASVAWHPLGFKTSWLSEIAAFPKAVLAHHYPHTPNMGDMTKIAKMIKRGLMNAPLILVGGTPCQAFSIAGLGDSLDDPRGQLTLEFVRIANAIDEKRKPGDESIVVWENVPGVLSKADNPFGHLLAGLAGEDSAFVPSGSKWSKSGIVYGPQRTVAWRVLDAQYYGLAQRRKRLFIVASGRKGFDPGAVLFEFDGLRRDIKKSRGRSDTHTTTFNDGVTKWPSEIASTLEARLGQSYGYDNQHIRNGAPLFFPEIAPTLTAAVANNGGIHTKIVGCNLMAFHENQNGRLSESDVFGVLSTGGGKPGQGYGALRHGFRVRRIMPVECERIMGFPDGYTAIKYKGKPALDRHRIHALGNSMPVPVMTWLGERIVRGLHA